MLETDIIFAMAQFVRVSPEHYRTALPRPARLHGFALPAALFAMPAAVEAATPFPICGASHQAVLVLTMLAAGGLILLFRCAGGRAAGRRIRRGVCLGLAAAIVAGLAAEHVAAVSGGYWSLRESLPLHLCDLANFVLLAVLLGVGLRKAEAPHQGQPRVDALQRCYELSYFWGLGGTAQALLTPDVRADFPDWACLRFFAQHVLIVAGVAALTFGLGMRPLPGAFGRVWIATLTAAIIAFSVNLGTGGNYMYLSMKPAQATLLDLLGPYPYSLVGLVLLASGLLALLYLPYYLADCWRLRAAEPVCPLAAQNREPEKGVGE